MIGATTCRYAHIITSSFTSEGVQTLFFDKATGHMRKIWCLGTKLVQWRIRGGGFKNLERGGSATGTQSTPENFWVATPTSGHMKIRTEYLEATLGLVKCLEITDM